MDGAEAEEAGVVTGAGCGATLGREAVAGWAEVSVLGVAGVLANG